MEINCCLSSKTVQQVWHKYSTKAGFGKTNEAEHPHCKELVWSQN